MGLKQRARMAVMYGAVIAAAAGCTPERYHVDEAKGAYLLVDRSTDTTRPINNGVAATIDDAVAMIEQQEGSEKKLSRQYQEKVVFGIAGTIDYGMLWQCLDDDKKRELAARYMQGLPKGEQIEIISGPLMEKAAVIAEGAMAEASKAFQGAKGIFEKAEAGYTELTVDMARESYQRIRKMIGGGQD